MFMQIMFFTIVGGMTVAHEKNVAEIKGISKVLVQVPIKQLSDLSI